MQPLRQPDPAAPRYERHRPFEPLDFIARLAALVPRPRVHLTRYHGVFAPHRRWRAAITPAGRGSATTAETRTPAERHRALSWAQRLKRVFRIDIESCERCGGKVRIIASLSNPAAIGKILAHLGQGASAPLAAAHPPRAPPAQAPLDPGGAAIADFSCLPMPAQRPAGALLRPATGALREWRRLAEIQASDAATTRTRLNDSRHHLGPARVVPCGKCGLKFLSVYSGHLGGICLHAVHA